MNPGNCVFQSAVCLENHTAFTCYIFDTHRLSICRPLSPPAWRRTAQCSPDLKHQRTPSATKRTLAKSRRSAAMSCFFALLGAYRLDHSASWLATLQWTLFVREEDEVDSMFRELLKHQPQCRFRETVYSMTEKTQFPGIHVSPGSAETLVRRGGITNHYLIACSPGNISAKNYQNPLMCVEVIVCNISVVFWDTVYKQRPSI